MKIAVFGDSFAANTSAPHIWWKVLQSFGHDITCYGESGSSLMFSAALVDQHAKNYDLAIWCTTTPGRFSVKVNNEYVHFCRTVVSDNLEVQKINQAVEDYRKYLFDWNTENLAGKAIIAYLEIKYKNIMVIPSFPPPVYTYPDPIGFNLYHLSEREAQTYFPKLSLPEIYEKYHDLRSAHLTPINNVRLAEQVNQHLKPGLFQTAYENFDQPTDLVETVFELIK